MKIRQAEPADASGIAKVHVDSWRSTYTGIMPDKVLANLSYARREELWTRMIAAAAQERHAIYVAEDDAGQIVGFADGGAVREADLEFDGELYAIYLLQEVQGQGVGRRLTGAVARALAANGINAMLVWVLADNPSRHFYARLGAAQVKARTIELGGARLEEVAYGWTAAAFAPLLV